MIIMSTYVEKKDIMPWRVFRQMDDVLPEIWRDFRQVQAATIDLETAKARCNEYLKRCYKYPLSYAGKKLDTARDVYELLRELMYAAVFQGTYFEVTQEGAYFPKMVLITQEYLRASRLAAKAAILNKDDIPDGISFEVLIVSDDREYKNVACHVRKKEGSVVATLVRLNQGAHTFKVDAKGELKPESDFADTWLEMARVLCYAAFKAAKSANGKRRKTIDVSRSVRMDGEIALADYTSRSRFLSLVGHGSSHGSSDGNSDAVRTGSEKCPHTRAGCTATSKNGTTFTRRPCIVHRDRFGGLSSAKREEVQ